MTDHTTTELPTRPDCDVCGQPAIADARTKRGSWGYLCLTHFASMAVGLGLGKGQLLMCGDSKDAELKAHILGLTS